MRKCTYFQPDSKSLQFLLNDLFVSEGFEDIQHNEDKIGSSGHSNDLPASALAVFSSLNDPRQVQQLDLGPLVLDTAGDRGESGELVGRHLTVNPGKVGQQSGLSH